MEDEKIVELYLARDENALLQTKQKYDRYLKCIAYNILYSDLDAEECTNDAYLAAWNSIPPSKPKSLRAYVGKIARNLALNRYIANRAKKRSENVEITLNELSEVIADKSSDGRDITDELTLKYALNAFIGSLNQTTRGIFVRRYWYLSPIKEIALDYHMTQSNVKVTLLRTRQRLKELLDKEGIVI